VPPKQAAKDFAKELLESPKDSYFLLSRRELLAKSDALDKKKKSKEKRKTWGKSGLKNSVKILETPILAWKPPHGSILDDFAAGVTLKDIGGMVTLPLPSSLLSFPSFLPSSSSFALSYSYRPLLPFLTLLRNEPSKSPNKLSSAPWPSSYLTPLASVFSLPGTSSSTENTEPEKQCSHVLCAIFLVCTPRCTLMEYTWRVPN
jgi:hypothetical protein